jgi:hypothetical protein
MYIVPNTLKISSQINLDMKEAEKCGIARERKSEGLTALLLIKWTDASVHEEYLSHKGVNLSHSRRGAKVLS